MKQKIKRLFAAALVTALLFGSIPLEMAAFPAQAAEKNFEVQFDNTYAKIGEKLSVIASASENAAYTWYVGGKQIQNTTNTYTPTESDLEKWIEVVVTADGQEKRAKLYCSKLPVVYIETENNAEITSKEDYINATMTIQGNETYNTDTTTLYDGAIEIRGRGNSTWEQPKKPYRIKLDKKTDVFGMGENKHWVLLANFLDDSLMRNTLSYDLSGSMGMEQMSTVWVDVIMNGEYIGNYQFCEQVRVDESRVDIFDWENFAEDTAEMIADAEGLEEGDLADYMLENMEWITSGEVTFDGKTYQIADYPNVEIPSIDGGYLLELDEYYDEISKFRTDSEQPVMFKNPEFVNSNSAMMSYVQTYVQAFENAVRSPGYTAVYDGEEIHYSELYDLDSLVNYWLVSEIFFNEEFNKKSTYMYKEIGELMKMGPIWDMDWCAGAEGSDALPTDQWATNYFDSYEQSEQWYKYLAQDPYFLVAVQERYWEIRDVQVQDMLDSIDTHFEYLKESGAADTARWEGMSFFRTSFEDKVADLKNWLNEHIAWMDEQMSTEDRFAASFLSSERDFELILIDSNGNALAADDTAKAPADGMLTEKEDVTLTIHGNIIANGTTQVYVNGRKYSSFLLTEETVDTVITANALTASNGGKNTIEVKIADKQGVVVAANYVTIRAYNGDDVPVDPTPEPTVTPTPTGTPEPTITPEPTVTPEPTPVNPFEDVSETDYFYNPVIWAVENGVTKGWTDTLFEPDMDCTRGQVVTFLYRAAGEPEVQMTKKPFTDIIAGAYYEKAVLWAVENKITTGWTATTFEPNMTCTRGQIVTFIWRAEGEPAPAATKNPFTDIAVGDYYGKAVLWAAENGITTGWTEDTFEPHRTCTRGQIVSFLYRYHSAS